MSSNARSPRARATYLAVISLAAWAVVGCAPSLDPYPEDADRPTVIAATVAPHAWLAAEIAGPSGAFEILTVLPAGANPHAHMPTDAEVSALARAELLLRSGVPFENGSWVDALARQGLAVVDLRDGLDLLRGDHSHADDGPADDHGNDARGVDPHTWLSPRRLARQATAVTDALVGLRPADAAELRRRHDEVVRRLESLDDELTARLAPYRGRAFFVHHPSWSYFAADYGLEQIAVEEGGHEPSDARMTWLQRRARDESVNALFVQPQVAGVGARSLAAALGIEVRTLDPLAADVPANLRTVAEALIVSWDGADRAALK